MTTDDTCRVCNKVHGVDGWNPRHQSVLGDNPTGSLPKKQKDRPTPVGTAAASAWPFDPVLRQALIDKGVLTPQDLRDAEDKIRAVTSATLGGSYGADRPAESRAEGVASGD